MSMSIVIDGERLGVKGWVYAHVEDVRDQLVIGCGMVGGDVSVNHRSLMICKQFGRKGNDVNVIGLEENKAIISLTDYNNVCNSVWSWLIANPEK